MQIKAIETHYGGFRFRSRLEARWAVFLDACELEYDYEPEGLKVPTESLGTLNYLPDFWLDSSAQWGEVKGFLPIDGMRRLHAIACSLTSCEDGNDLVVFGDVPRPRSALWPVQLHYHGRLWGVPWEPHSAGCPLDRARVAVEPTEQDAGHLCNGFPFGIPEWAEDALERARFARFEWGESG
jgi:hypothetical protein